MMNKNNKNDEQSSTNNEYYRTVTDVRAPPIYNEVTPLIDDNYRYNNNNSQSNPNNILNSHPEYIYVFHNTYRRQRFHRLFIYILMLLILIGLFLLFLILFVNYTQNFQYLLFVRRWPPTFCKQNINSNNKEHCRNDYKKYNYWIIHGLWPENNDNTWNQYCNKNNKFDINKIETLKNNLTKIWPNLLSNEPEDSLWKHEWNKHGTCTKMNEYDYFSNTIDLYNKYNFMELFNKNQIIPTLNHKYKRTDIENILNESIKNNSNNIYYILNCKQFNNDSYLDEIWLCLSFHDFNQPSYCTMKSTCPDEFYYTD